MEFAAGAARVQGRVGRSRVRQGGLTPDECDVLEMWSIRILLGVAAGDLSVLGCGNSMSADVNSAINILMRAMAGGTSPPTICESSELCPR